MSTEAWAPEPAGVAQIVSMLTEYHSPTADQAQVYARLRQCAQFPDFNNYLAHLLARGADQAVEVRQSAGLLLKNNLKNAAAWKGCPAPYRAFVRGCLLAGVATPDRALRTTVGTALGTVVSQSGVGDWPELFPALAQLLESAEVDHVDGALDAFYKICEEAAHQLDEQLETLGGQRPADLMIPRLFNLFRSPHEPLRSQAVRCVCYLVPYQPSALRDSMATLVQGLFALADDPSNAVRTTVCNGLVAVLQVDPDQLHTHMRQVMQYMLRSTQDDDDSLALESCEFWTAFCELQMTDEYIALLREFIPQLIPVLLKNMAYEEDDEEVLQAEEDEVAGDQPDRAQDVRPSFHSARQAGSGEGGLDGDEDDGDDDDDGFGSWTLRKCSASGLDTLSSVFGDELLPFVLPQVQTNLNHADWRYRESAILAIGAVAEGCKNGLMQYLAQLVSFLLPMLKDPRPMVRVISCWALGRYSRYVIPATREGSTTVPNLPPAQALQLLDGMLSGLLERVLDHNKKVQEAACSALASLEEYASNEEWLLQRVDPIVRALSLALGKYQRRNLRILCDALGTLADQVGDVLSEPQYFQALVPPLLQKWQELGDESKELFPLFECLMSVATAVGQAFAVYVEPVFARCTGMVRTQVALKQAVACGEVDGEYEKEFIISALDLLSSLVEATGEGFGALVASSDILTLTMACCEDEHAEVRQSAFALFGDLARVCPASLAGSQARLFDLAIRNLLPEMLRPENMLACNNACWMAGELAVRLQPAELNAYVVPLAQRICPLFVMKVHDSLRQNAAITLGRVLKVAPEQMAPHLAQFVVLWTKSLRKIRDNVEKEDAFYGLCAVTRLNPGVVLQTPEAPVALCYATCSWLRIKPELQAQMQQLLHGLRDMAGAEQWAQLTAELNPAARSKLQGVWGV